MALLSKIKPVTLTFQRNFRFPNHGAEPNPLPRIMEFAQEPHAKHCTVPLKIALYFIIPVMSAFAWYKEYNHVIAHPHRYPWPKQFFFNAAQKPWPWGESGKSFFHHPYFNFTNKGYETDQHGNPLPPGVYSEI